MNQKELIVWVFERTLLRGVRYVAHGHEAWEKSGGGIWSLEAALEQPPQEADAPQQGELVEADKPLVRVVREAKEATHASHLVLGLPLSRLLVQVMKFPPEMREDLADAVALQMDKLSPFPGEELTVGHEVLSENETTIWVLAAAMPSVVFEEIGGALQHAKLHVLRTDIAFMGWFRSLCGPLQLTRPGRRVILMDMDDEGWDLMVIDHGVPVLMRGLGPLVDAESLTRQIMLSLLNAELEAGSCSVSEVMVVSHVPPPAEVMQKIRDLIGAPVQHQMPPGADGGAEGVALRTIEKATLDLTPVFFRNAVQEARIAKHVRIGVVAASVVWALIMGILFGIPAGYTFMTRQIRAQSKAHAQAYKQVADMRDRVNLIRSYMDRTRSPLELLRITTEHLPPQGISLVSMTYKKEDGVKLSGEADEPTWVYTYKNAMTEDPLFETVTLNGPSASKGRHKFDIDARFKGAGEKK